MAIGLILKQDGNDMKDKSRMNFIPGVITLLAAAVASIVLIINKYPLKDFLIRLLIVIIVFYFVGIIVRSIAKAFLKVEIPEEEAVEEESETEGEEGLEEGEETSSETVQSEEFEEK